LGTPQSPVIGDHVLDLRSLKFELIVVNRCLRCSTRVEGALASTSVERRSNERERGKERTDR
jgi:hypothetical protein